MQFILVYNRPQMVLLDNIPFANEASEEALHTKLALELRYANNNDVEVAFFQSDSEATLRKTHSRYFKTLSELAAGVDETIEAS